MRSDHWLPDEKLGMIVLVEKKSTCPILGGGVGREGVKKRNKSVEGW